MGNGYLICLECLPYTSLKEIEFGNKNRPQFPIILGVQKRVTLKKTPIILCVHIIVQLNFKYIDTRTCFPVQIDLHEANQRLSSGAGGAAVGSPAGPILNAQEMDGLKKTIEEQKKIIEEKQAELEQSKKANAELENKVKQQVVNVRILSCIFC